MRRRVAVAKTGLALLSALVFGMAMLFSRVYYAGHHKHRLSPLAPPPRFLSVVRANQLEAGVIATAQAPPGAETAQS